MLDIDPSPYSIAFVWIDAGMRHYVVWKTEETSQMERPPFLWWDQHTHTHTHNIAANTKMKRVEDIEMNSGWLGF